MLICLLVMSLSHNSGVVYFIRSGIDNRMCITCIMYADDLIIIALSCPSVCGLQRLLDICASTVTCLQFIDKKAQCKLLYFPRHHCQPASMSLLGKYFLCVNSLKCITF